MLEGSEQGAPVRSPERCYKAYHLTHPRLPGPRRLFSDLHTLLGVMLLSTGAGMESREIADALLKVTQQSQTGLLVTTVLPKDPGNETPQTYVSHF